MVVLTVPPRSENKVTVGGAVSEASGVNHSTHEHPFLARLREKLLVETDLVSLRVFFDQELESRLAGPGHGQHTRPAGDVVRFCVVHVRDRSADPSSLIGEGRETPVAQIRDQSSIGKMMRDLQDMLAILCSITSDDGSVSWSEPEVRASLLGPVGCT